MLCEKKITTRKFLVLQFGGPVYCQGRPAEFLNTSLRTRPQHDEQFMCHKLSLTESSLKNITKQLSVKNIS